MTLISHVSRNATWIIEFGSSRNMIGDKTKFEHLDYYDGGSIKSRNNEPCYVKGKGCIPLIDELKCDNAYWVEGLRYNLLSVA